MWFDIKIPDFIKNIHFLRSTPEDSLALSFVNYKIDYNRCLGHGVYGNVYRLAVRPDNEKNFWSDWFPFVYDYIYRIGEKPDDEQSKKYCVKIFKPALQVLLENLDHPFPLQRVANSFSEPSVEIATNQTLRKHNMSEIMFFSSGRYSQFKTRVRGKTFRYYLDKGYFTDPEQYEFRKSFIQFLRSLYKSNLVICDMHPENLMYDKHRSCWEIIDGGIKEAKNDGSLDRYFDVSNIVKILTRSERQAVRETFEILEKMATDGKEYTLTQDDEFFQLFCDIKNASPQCR